MKDIKVDKYDLLAKVRDNRGLHQAEYDQAVMVFRERAAALMQQHLDEARRGGEVKLYVQLPVPEIHLDDYDRAIQMLEWEQGDEIVLSESDFGVYVLNQWGWAKSFAQTTSSYNSR